MAVPVLEGTAITDVTSNATSATVTLPASVAADDIIILCISMDNAPTTFANSGGITMVEFGIDNEPSVTLVYMIGRASGGETTQNITWLGSQQGRIMALRISGVDSSAALLDLIDIIGAVTSGAGTTGNVAAITSTETDTLAICAVAVDRDRVDGADGLSDAQGFTEVGTSGSSGGANGAGLIVAEKDLASVGGSLSPTFGTWASDGFVTKMFNIFSTVPVTDGFVHSQAVIIG